MARARESPLSVRRIEAAERQVQALELRKRGKTFQDIADSLGYATAQGAYLAVESGLKRTQQQPADSVRQLELERLDKLLDAMWDKATAGKDFSVDRVLAIMDRRARYLGLDKPVKFSPTDADGNSLDLAMLIVRARLTDAQTD